MNGNGIMETLLDDRYLLVSGASLYIAVILTGVVWVWRRPNGRDVRGALLAFCWNLPTLLALQLAASHFNWWQFDAQGGLLLGAPVDLVLSWAWLWGFVLAIAFPTLPLVLVVAIALAADLALMPAATPVVVLGSYWLAGEAVGLIFVLIPGQLLARWTTRGIRLSERVVLQMMVFGGLIVFVLPAIAIDSSGSAWLNPFSRPAWQWSLMVQVLAIPALFGVSAVQEFVVRGRGTPVPFDPPQRLVVSGVYAYVRNPMQLSAVVLLVLLGLMLKNIWVSAAGVMAHIYAIGLAGWDEDTDLRLRFGESWTRYRQAVQGWIPRRRPWFQNDSPDARLFVASRCGMCTQVGQWFTRRGAVRLEILPAETYGARALTRITYTTADGTGEFSGVQAIARALEHIHLGWAMIGWLLRLPVICQFAQLLIDASGGEPRSIAGPVPR
jgi:protein-S-isoprenylcysteine O-methyltransferase Ste14